MKWSEALSTGVALLDEQHKTLFRMSDDYREALAAGKGARVYKVMLDSLYVYARSHFGSEEQCMHRSHCPAAAANADAHGRFLAVLAEYRQRYAVSGYREDEAARLVDFIDGWLAGHIGGIDVQLKPCVEASPPV